MKNRIRVERAEVRMTQQQLADAVGVSARRSTPSKTTNTIPRWRSPSLSRASWKPPSTSFSHHNDEQPQKIGAAIYLCRTGIRISVMLSAMDFATASLSPVS